MLSQAESLSENSTIAAKLVTAFWLAGIYLDVLGAVLATITTRWLELLNSEETQTLNQEWPTTEREDSESSIRKPRRLFSSLWDSIIAAALFSGLPVVACGVSMFLIGLVIYVWASQPLLVSIISTIPFVALIPLIVVCRYPHSGRKNNILELLARKRGAWWLIANDGRSPPPPPLFLFTSSTSLFYLKTWKPEKNSSLFILLERFYLSIYFI